jgi:glycosyltransferase involved in cell wall biosynthesis
MSGRTPVERSVRPAVSIVVPVYNGGPLVDDLYRALAPVLDDTEGGAELVCVDDGSRDDTLGRLRAIVARDSRVRIVELAANFGQHAAFAAGFEYARGDRLVTMDADLQCDPRDIPRLLAPLAEGYDLVSGVRLGRQDPFMRRVFSRILTWLVGRMAGVPLRDIGCPYNAFTREVASSLAAFGELRRFLKPLAVRVARGVTEVEVAHRPRHQNRRRSSYSATALVRLFMDFFVNSLGDVFAWVFVGGVAAAVVSTLLLFWALVSAGTPAGDSVFVIGSALLALGAALLALLGLAGDYVQRIYRQSSGRPFYLVRRLHEASATVAPAGPDRREALVEAVAPAFGGDGA